MNPQWSETELAYFAGIVDGEGCISLMRPKNPAHSRYGTSLFIGNTDPRLINWVHQRFGGSVTMRKRNKQAHKDLWCVEWHGSGVEPILAAILPYLVLKREQATLMLEFRTTVRPRGANTPNSQDVIDRRAELKGKISALNRRGA